MGVLDNAWMGFAVAVTPRNLLYALAGCLIGTLVGVLPGVGPLAGISLLLPATFGMDPAAAIILLAAIYYGSQYGGSTTSILMNIPGESSSVVTCLDGYRMAQQGRAGPALGIAAFGSYIAGTLSVAGLMLFAPLLARVAVDFGPPEFFALMVLGLVLLGYMSSGSMLKTLMMAAVGLILGTVGIDPITGYLRFTYGQTVLADGIGFIPVAMGLFGVGEVLYSLGEKVLPAVQRPSLRTMLPTRQDWKDSAGPIGRASVIGFLIGILPGSAHVVSTFVSYALERRLSKHPERFGHGAIEGVAGPEAANNAATGGAMIPLLSVGIPSGPAPAVMMAALMIHGVRPGPLLMQENPRLFWGVIASMYVGNLMLLILNLPLVGLFVNLLRIPYPILYPVVLLFTVIGSYGISGNIGDVVIMFVFGVIGYLMRHLRFDAAPVVLALVLGPQLENSFRQSLLMSGGSFAIFFARPASAVLLAAGVALLALACLPPLARRIRGRLLAGGADGA